MKRWLKIIGITLAGLAAVGMIGLTIAFGTMFFLEKDYTEEKKQEDNEPAVTETAADTAAAVPVKDYGNIEKPEYQNAGEFIKDFHKFYNDTTGWDRIENLNMADQEARASAAKGYAEHFIPLVEEQALKNDLQAIIRHSESVINGNGETVQTLHRYFHDLDIVINGYVHEDFFGVVKSK